MTIQGDLNATTPRLWRTPPEEGNNTPPMRGTPPEEGNKNAIQRAMESCEACGYAASDHFRSATKMIELGSGAIAMGKTWSSTP